MPNTMGVHPHPRGGSTAELTAQTETSLETSTTVTTNGPVLRDPSSIHHRFSPFSVFLDIQILDLCYIHIHNAWHITGQYRLCPGGFSMSSDNLSLQWALMIESLIPATSMSQSATHWLLVMILWRSDNTPRPWSHCLQQQYIYTRSIFWYGLLHQGNNDKHTFS